MKQISSKSLILVIALLISFSVFTTAQIPQQSNKPQSPTPSTSQIPQQKSQLQSQQLLYTQNINQFKSKKYNQRLQTLVGCWLMSKQYLDLYKSNYLFFKDHQLKQTVSLQLVKQCMKKISRKDAILKITQLVGKNLQPAKKFQDVIPKTIIDKFFLEVSQFTIANYHQYQPINQDLNAQTDLQNKNSSRAQNEAINQVQAQANIQNSSIQTSTSNQQLNNSPVNSTQQQPQTSQSTNSFNTLSEFDHFLLDLLKKYNHQFQKLANSKQGLRGRVQEQLKKRQKYYFGFIPASSFTHSVFLVTISLSMVFCCTCYKYYKMRTRESQSKKMKNSQQCDDNCKSHTHVKEVKKMTKMTQLTMKKKVK